MNFRTGNGPACYIDGSQFVLVGMHNVDFASVVGESEHRHEPLARFGITRICIRFNKVPILDIAKCLLPSGLKRNCIYYLNGCGRTDTVGLLCVLPSEYKA